MTSTEKKEENYGYWSDKASKRASYSLYDSAEGKGPVKVTFVTDDPPDKVLKRNGWKDLKYVGKVTKHLKSYPSTYPPPATN